MNRISRAFLTFVIVVACAIVSAACRHASSGTAYVPELGELMALQQMRYTKIWLAGQAGNWPLAAYEADELGEGFDAVVAFHPTHENAPVAPKDAIPRMVTQPLADLKSAVARRDGAAFEQTYDALTTACNNCHQALNYGFLRVQRPEANPYPSQVFEPPTNDTN
jgi:hypothetical protein